MTATDQKPGWLARNRNMLFLLGCVVLGQAFLYFTTTANTKREAERYRTLQLAGRVTRMLSYSHGMQKVQLATGETPTLALTAAGHEYIQAGDSLVKAVGSDSITAYRWLPGRIEMSVFGPNATGKKSLIKYSE